jgi:hypothetical protein
MTPHIADELPSLLTGEAPRDVVLAAAGHLRECEDCRQELVAAVVAHASLASAQRFAPEVVASLTEATAADTSELPDLTAVFEQIRADAAAEAARPRRSRARVYAAAAVAAGVLVGGGAVALVELNGSSSAVTTVALAAFGDGRANGKVTVTDGRMNVDASALPHLDAAHRYEVWLTDTSRTRMQPLGWIDTDGKAQLTVPANLMSQYRAIEVSVQQVNASNYTYSGTSVLRGTYG